MMQRISKTTLRISNLMYNKHMKITLSKSAKSLFAMGIFAIVLINSFYIFNIGMKMDANGSMNCPFLQGGSMCPMNPLDHIAAAEAFFNGLPQWDIFSFLLTLELVPITFLYNMFIRKVRWMPVRFSNYSPPRNYLQEAFSNGILNPKTF